MGSFDAYAAVIDVMIDVQVRDNQRLDGRDIEIGR